MFAANIALGFLILFYAYLGAVVLFTLGWVLWNQTLRFVLIVCGFVICYVIGHFCTGGW